MALVVDYYYISTYLIVLDTGLLVECDNCQMGGAKLSYWLAEVGAGQTETVHDRR